VPGKEERDMSLNESLGVYLNDHLAGAATGLELAEKLRSKNHSPPMAAELSSLVADISEDRATLEGLMEALGIDTSSTKQAAGWVIEKLTRLKMSRRLTGSPELARLLEMETLSLGIEGKLAMWRALKAIAGADSRLAGTDFDRLIDRARQQRERLEPHRLEAATGAFLP
jgi:hypothetical protein